MNHSSDIPERFEDSHPAAASFMAAVFKAGGRFKQTWESFKAGKIAPPIVDVSRNHPCPCGSTLKAKRCHEHWTK